MADSIFDRFPRPPCADLLGWELLEQDAAAGRVKIRFQGRPEFLNPAGFIQGGILAAMLDDTMGPAALVASGGELYTVTIDLQVSYLAPARPGPLIGEAQVVQLGKTIGFIEGALSDAAGVVVARGRTSARLARADRLAAA